MNVYIVMYDTNNGYNLTLDSAYKFIADANNRALELRKTKEVNAYIRVELLRD